MFGDYATVNPGFAATMDKLTPNGRRFAQTRMHARVEIIDEFATNGTRAGAGAGARHRNCCE